MTGAIDRELEACPLRQGADAIVLDFHAEATSEKQGVGFFCDGRVSLVVGTHTHVPTADHQVLPGGTAYMSDAGMTGDYDSVIGMQKEEPLQRFLTGKTHTPVRWQHLGHPAILETQAHAIALQQHQLALHAGEGGERGILLDLGHRQA